MTISFSFFQEQFCLIGIYCVAFHKDCTAPVHRFYRFKHLQVLAVRYLSNYGLYDNALWRRVCPKCLSLARQ